MVFTLLPSHKHTLRNLHLRSFLFQCHPVPQFYGAQVGTIFDRYYEFASHSRVYSRVVILSSPFLQSICVQLCFYVHVLVWLYQDNVDIDGYIPD